MKYTNFEFSNLDMIYYTKIKTKPKIAEKIPKISVEIVENMIHYDKCQSKSHCNQHAFFPHFLKGPTGAKTCI